MTRATTTTTFGLSAVLRALMIVLLIALVVPAFAMADDTAAAVLDQPPAAEAPTADQPTTDMPPPDNPPVADAPAPPAAEQTPPVQEQPQQPVDQGPAVEPDPQPTTPPAGGLPTSPDPVVVIPTPVEPPAEVVPVIPPPPVVTLPVVDAIPTILPELVPTPATAPDDADAAARLLPVVLGPATVADVPATRSVVFTSGTAAPVAPSSITLASGTDTPAPFAGVTLDTTPTAPSAATVSGLLTSGAALHQDLFSLDPNRTRTLPGAAAGDIEPGAGMRLAGQVSDASALFAETIGAPIGAVASGSSLLAVLAGYVLPGVAGPPATSIIMFILVGLIVGLARAPRPQLSERLHLGGLLGARTGHGLAVCRPG